MLHQYYWTNRSMRPLHYVVKFIFETDIRIDSEIMREGTIVFEIYVVNWGLCDCVHISCELRGILRYNIWNCNCYCWFRNLIFSLSVQKRKDWNVQKCLLNCSNTIEVSLNSAVFRAEWSGSRPSRLILGESHMYPLSGKEIEFQRCSGSCEEEKDASPSRESNPDLLIVYPVV